MSSVSMKIRNNFDNYLPLPLAFVLIFLILNLSFFLLFELIFSLMQFSFSEHYVVLSSELILLAVLLSNCLLIVFLLVFLHFNRRQFSSSSLLAKLSAKSAITAIIVSVAFMIFLKYGLITLWTTIIGEIKVDLFPWPFHLFEPSKFDISYLIFFILIFVMIQPFWEELLFRRILAGSLLKQGFNHGYAVILSSFAYSFYFAIYLLVDISINDLLWFLLTNLIGGIILGTLFVKTEQIRYSYIVSSLINMFLLLLFLSQNHFEFIPYREFFLAISLLVVLLGLLIIFFEIFQKILDHRFVSTLIDFRESILTFSWPRRSNLKNYWITLLCLLPGFPLGVVVFVDHTILYTDLLAIILENCISVLILLTFSIVLYSSISTSLSIIPNNEIDTLKLNLSGFFTNSISKRSISFKSILYGIRSRIIIIIISAGIISPFYILSVVARTKVEIVFIWQALVDISMLIVQNPFFTYQHVVTEIRSNIIFIGNRTEVIQEFFFFQQSRGKWNFLPDTYMSSSSDWIHGLLTVILWIGIISFYVYLLRISGQYPLKSALGAVLLIIMNFVWILFALGFGSLTEGGRPSGIPSLEDISFIIKFDISIKEFLILPLGFLLFLIAAVIIFIQFLKRRNKEKLTTSMVK